MTIIAGWRSGGSVFLASDTGLTRTSAPNQPRSSIGQAQATGFGCIEEALPKVLPVSATLAVAYCGDGRPARRVVSALKDYSSISRIDRLLPQIWTSVTTSPDEHVQLLLAERHDGTSQLWRWASECPTSLEPVSDFAICGSLRPALKTRIERTLLQLRECPADSILPVVMAVLHQMCAVHDVVADNVAGILVGCCVSPAGFTWQDDTTYLLHPPDLALAPRTDSPSFDPASASKSVGWDLIATVVRDNVAVLHTTVGDRVLAMLDSLSAQGTPLEWWTKWLPEIREVFRARRSRYYVFLNRRSPTVVIVDSRSHSEGGARRRGPSRGPGADVAVRGAERCSGGRQSLVARVLAEAPRRSRCDRDRR
jgi:hypothetical protein